MPELAEVAYYRARWDEGLGQPITRVHLHPNARIFRGSPDPARIPSLLTGSSFLASHSHGKNLLFQFAHNLWLTGHLGMTGSLSSHPPHRTPEKHDHLILFQKHRSLVFSDPRMFGKISLETGPAPPVSWTSLPPEILSDAFSKSLLASALARRSRTPIKPLLLDQAIFPGIGNWMADEILWRTRIHPATPAGLLTHLLPSLWTTTRKVARLAMQVIAPNWSHPPDTWLFNHRWSDANPCPRCRTTLTRQSLRGRTSCWCPSCQPAP